jgi:hypothetical protein
MNVEGCDGENIKRKFHAFTTSSPKVPIILRVSIRHSLFLRSWKPNKLNQPQIFECEKEQLKQNFLWNLLSTLWDFIYIYWIAI